MNKRLILPIASTIAAVSYILAAAYPMSAHTLQKHNDDVQAVQPYALGPGHENLSSGDEYAVYQWAFQNEGELEMVGVDNRFAKVNPLLATLTDRANQSGKRSPAGPGSYEEVRVPAIAGIDIKMRQAWDVYDNSTGAKRQVIVGIIDTGIDINHPELKDSVWFNEDEIPGDGADNDGNGFVDDRNGWNFYDNNNLIYYSSDDDHGTHAAGTISAARNNEGIAGINDSSYVKIMPLKVLGSAEGVGTAEAVIQAIRYAEANGASICNLSFGTLTSYPELEAVIRSSPMLFIISVGNGDMSGIGYNIDQHPVYPASYHLDNTITVANLMFNGYLDQSSNYGRQSVDIAAPGTYILSCTSNSSYAFMSGTSMSAPMVTGVAAMLYSYRPELSLAEVKQIIIESARPLDSLTDITVSGKMLDAHAALTYGSQ